MLMDNPVLFAWGIVVTMITLQRGGVVALQVVRGRPFTARWLIPDMVPVCAAVCWTSLAILAKDLIGPFDERAYCTCMIGSGYAVAQVLFSSLEAHHRQQTEHLRFLNRDLWRRIEELEGDAFRGSNDRGQG